MRPCHNRNASAPNGQYHLQSPPPYHSQPQKPTGRNSSNTSWITMPPACSTREHQALPLMDSPPMRLMIDPNATPVAHHSPIPVPLHWQDTVKAGLDRDVRLWVLEPVPIGEPVTWCHRLVICAKQNSTPRRTIDFQPLTRETHHTQSPFHQARSVPQGKKTVFDTWNGYHSVRLHPDD